MADSSSVPRSGSLLTKVAGAFASFRDHESGAILAEYAILLSLIGLGLLSAVLTLGSAVGENIEQAAHTIEEARKGANCEEGAKIGNKWC
ncbi:MAG TPA: hypothetical protein VHG92_14715 [Afifellaceae bacterium]|nr:hypothetical protein [Afifellaceae bacterium]